MSKIIYAEPDDEITTLVDRLRAEKAEKQLAFVLPASNRALQSSLNARLLMQYSNSLGKHSAVISPDPRTQGVAIDTGFEVFPSVGAFEAGKALAAPMSAPVEQVPSEPVHRPAGGNRPIAVGVGAGAGEAAAQAPPRTPSRARAVERATEVVTGDSRIPIFVGVGAAVLLILLAIIVLPSATVTIVTAARAVSVTPVINGSTAPPGPNDNLAIQTALEQAQETSASQQFPATGQKTVPGAAATGSVVFSNHSPNPFEAARFPPGTEVYTDANVKFLTTQDSGFVQPGATSNPIPVTARDMSAAGNVPAGAIDHITSNNRPQDFMVNNPTATSGGQDPQQKTIVSQADLDKAKAQLGDPLKQKVQDEMNQKANGLKVLAETVVIDPQLQADHKVNDETPNFNASVAVKGHATAVDENKLKQLIKDALSRQVSADYRLTDDPISSDYHFVSHSDNGDVQFQTSGSGFEAPAIDSDQLRKNISGKSQKDARQYIEQHVSGVNDVRISEGFSILPVLPYISGRIDIKTQAEKSPSG